MNPYEHGVIVQSEGHIANKRAALIAAAISTREYEPVRNVIACAEEYLKWLEG